MRIPFRAASRWLSVHRNPSQTLSLSALRQRQRGGGGGAPIDIHPEVLAALASHKPVVGLETAITTHGLPYPSNRDTALSLERIVRSVGAVPATIGLVQGRVKIGLDESDVERLADPANASTVVKVSRRDIAPAIAAKKDGGTTVSATMIFAALTGIDVIATGGYENHFPPSFFVIGQLNDPTVWEVFIEGEKFVRILYLISSFAGILSLVPRNSVGYFC
jgi:hypothetical protein